MISTPSALKVASPPKTTTDDRVVASPRSTEARTSPTTDMPASVRVHAVVIHHRGMEMLNTCLETLLLSEKVELEIVVVSNHCLEPLPDLVTTHDRIHVADTGRPIGFSEANNVGVKWAKSNLGTADYYYFLNNDTESRPDTLFHLVDAVEKKPLAAAAGPLTLIQAFPDHLNSLGINVTDDAWGWDEGIGQKLADYGPLPEIRPVLTITGSAYLLDSEVYDQVGGWTEAYEWYFEDIDLGIKIWKLGRQVIHVPQAEILHRVSATMTVGAERKQYFFWRNRILLALIHWPKNLLWPLLRRAIYWEIAKAPWASTRLQRKALWGAVRHLPKALLLRHRLKGPDDWKEFLRPAGSVPVISLPRPSEPAGAGASSPDGTSAQEGDPTWVKGRSAHRPSPGDPWQCASALRNRPTDPEAEINAGETGAVETGVARKCRIMVLGWGPLPFEEQRMNYAPGARSLQFARALAAAGHTVCLAYARIPGSYLGDPPDLLCWNEGGSEGDFLIYQMGLTTFNHPGAIEGLVEAFAPHALVGAAPIPSRRAVQVAGGRPVWVDLFGDPMAEAQAKDRAQPEHEDGDHLTAYWQLMHELLSNGDAFSSVSERQRYAVIGQLGVSGRLNRATADQELVHVVPCAIPEQEQAGSDDGSSAGAGLEQLPDGFSESFIVLWSGGFNTWCDVDTLFEGLETSMAQEPSLRFVATGGSIENHDAGTFQRLQALAAASPYADRFALLGSLPKGEADPLRDRADLLIVTERSLYERELGSSGRILEWLSLGRPFLCTEQSELGSLIETHELGLTYSTGDSALLAKRIREAMAAPDRLQKIGNKARSFAEEHFSQNRTTEPLLRWAASAERAPDLVAAETAPKKYHALSDRLRRANESEERQHALHAGLPYRIYKRLRNAARGSV